VIDGRWRGFLNAVSFPGEAADGAISVAAAWSMAGLKLQLIQMPAHCLGEYGMVPISYSVSERFELVPACGEQGGWDLRPHRIEPGYVKDYDTIPGCRPTEWVSRWDTNKWWFGAAFAEGRWVGGAAVVLDASEVEGAAASTNVAILWDIRVRPNCRRRGVGRRLLKFAEDQACALGMRRMRVETQNVNVTACRFYAGAGYALCGVDRFGYADFPGEVQLIWQKDLA
jgi:GNAT superfamily N-acetyltransferase